MRVIASHNCSNPPAPGYWSANQSLRIASLTGDDLDGKNEAPKYPDGTVVRMFCMRTDRDAYPSGGPTGSTSSRLNFGFDTQ